MKKRYKRTVPPAKIRQKLEDRLKERHGGELFDNVEEKPSTKHPQSAAEFFPLAQLRWMHENLLFKSTAAIVVTLVFSAYLYWQLPYADKLAGSMHYITTWHMNTTYLQENALPVLERLWGTNRVDQFIPVDQIINDEDEEVKSTGEFALPVEGELASAYGLRQCAETGQNEMHYGLDFTAHAGEQVVASMTGKVQKITEHPQNGLTVYLEHAGAVETIYARLGDITVNEGMIVQAGQAIGSAGDSGYIHFEMRVNGGPVNPAFYIEHPVIAE